MKVKLDDATVKKYEEFLLQLPVPLSKEQREAVYPVAGITSILATAGAGKTATMAASIAGLMSVLNIRDQEILATSFTNASADELRERVDKFIKRKSSVITGTMHNYCIQLIRAHYRKLGYERSPTLLGDRQKKTILTQLIKDVLGPSAKKDDGGQLNVQNLERWLMWHEVTQHSSNPNDSIAFSQGLQEPPRAVREIIRRYLSYLKSHSYIDLDQILSKTLELLKIDRNAPSKVAETLPVDSQLGAAKQILEQVSGDGSILGVAVEKAEHADKPLILPNYVFIDEAQDLSTIQWLIIEELAKVAKCVTIIGDDDQSIYYFRGARPYRFRKFVDGSNRRIFLTLNRRCGKDIVNIARDIISKIPADRRVAKDLAAARPESGEVKFTALKDLKAYELVGIKILTEVQKSGRKWGSYALITRSTTRVFPAVEAAFKRLGIPYVLLGGKSAFEMPEMQVLKNLMAIYLASGEALTKRTGLAIGASADGLIDEKSQVKTEEEDAVNWLELMTNVGITFTAAENMIEAACTGTDRKLNAYAWALSRARIGQTSKSALIDIMMDLSHYRNDKKRPTLGEFIERRQIKKLLRRISEETVLTRKKSSPTKSVSGAAIDQDVIDSMIKEREEMYNTLIASSLKESVAQAFDSLSLRNTDTEETDKKDSVIVSTCHSAKGLEWETVFVCEANAYNWPSPMLKKSSANAPVELARDMKDEEVRLLFVAATRAKNNLIFLTTAIDEKTGDKVMPSEFFSKEATELYCQVIQKTAESGNSGSSVYKPSEAPPKANEVATKAK